LKVSLHYGCLIAISAKLKSGQKYEYKSLPETKDKVQNTTDQLW